MESERINLISSSTKLEGTIQFSEFTRFEGRLNGTLKSHPGSELILGQNSVVEGSVEGDVVIVDGFVRGEITATGKVIISSTGRVLGDIHSPSLAIEFGGYFDGKCEMQSKK